MKPLIEGPGAPDGQRSDERAAHAKYVPRQMAAGARLEQDLRGQEALLRELTENIHQVFWLASADQRQVFYVSPSYEHIFGRRCDDLLRKPMSWLEVVHPEDRPRIEAEVALDCGKGFTREYRIIRLDGAIRWILARGYPVCDKRGNVCRLAGLAEDITERKQLEQALRKSQSDLAEAQRVAQIGSWSFNPCTNEVVWSDELCRIFGLKQSEFGGTHEAFVACIHPEDRPRVLRIGAKARADGQPFDIEYRIVTPKGGLKVIQEIARPFKDDAGHLVGLIGTAQDITERRRTEQVIQKERDFISAVIDTICSLVVVLDRQARIVRFNRACERLTGYLFDEVRGQDVMDLLVMPEDRSAARGEFRNLRSGQFPNTFENHWVTKTGSPRLIAWSNTALLGADGVVEHVIATGIDITERKRAEQGMQMFSQVIVEAREEERRQVSSALHHDVGSMAMGISGYLDAIEKELRSRKAGQALAWMKRTRKLFDHSVVRLKGLAVQLRPPELDVLGLPAALGQYFFEMTKLRGVRIHFREAQRRNPISANAATTLFRVAQEAVTNAIKHGHAKQLNVSLRTSKEKIRLMIHDNGKGFDVAAQKARVTSQLGLRVMEEMATAAGGVFTIDSGRGKGTTVLVSLPRETTGLRPPGATMREEAATRGRPAFAPPGRGKTIRCAVRSSRARKGPRA